MLFISPDGQSVHPALVELARKRKIDVQSDTTPGDLSPRLQDSWRQGGKLSYQIEGGPPDAEELELLRRLGCVDEVLPLTERPPRFPSSDPMPIYYQGAIILGATRPAVVKRAAFLLRMASHTNIERDRGLLVYLLGGARPLDAVVESPEKLCTPAELPFRPGWIQPTEMPTTEAGMMELVWNQSQLPYHWRYELIDTPLQPKPDGGTRLPNTADTIKLWSQHGPQPGTYLAVSSNPHVTYQELVINNQLGWMWEIGVRTCGPAANPALALAKFLDVVAKQLFEEVLLIKK